MAESTTENCMPQVNDCFLSSNGYRYKLISVINEGGFGTVFKALYTLNNKEIFTALKAEKWDKSLQLIEVSVLKAAQNGGCRHFPKLLDYGSISNRFHFISLTLLGADLHKLRKEQSKAKFSLSSAIRIAYQTMKAIEELHVRCRFICRDIKPSNFVIGLRSNNTHRRIYIVDFGLCRRYVSHKGQVLSSRGEVGWRGTSRYGSLNCHLRMDLGRKDDLESWFYMLVELTTGALPWHQEKDREVVHSAKVNARTVGRGRFLAECPPEYEMFMNKIDSMIFEEEPHYQYFYSLIKEICVARRFHKSDPYDWEEPFKQPTTIHDNVQNLALAMMAKAFVKQRPDVNNNNLAAENAEPPVVPPTSASTLNDDMD